MYYRNFEENIAYAPETFEDLYVYASFICSKAWPVIVKPAAERSRKYEVVHVAPQTPFPPILVSDKSNPSLSEKI